MSDNITVTGNIATEPDYKHTPAGVPITSFRLATNQRRFDRASGVWVDGPTNYYSVSTFRRLAEHAHASLKKGDRVVLTGRVRMREWDNGTKRGTSVEIDAEAIGHDLLWGTTTFHRAPREGHAAVTAAEAVLSDEIDEWRAQGIAGPSPEPDAAPAVVAGAWNVASGADADALAGVLAAPGERSGADAPF